jgi:hypothetical protein
MPYMRPNVESPTRAEGTPIKLKPQKASKTRAQAHCEADTKAGHRCKAPVVEKGLCYFHAHPERLVELGRQGGRRNRRPRFNLEELATRSLKNVREVADLLEETINSVRQGKIDLRASNAIGFLSGILLKALEKGPVEERLNHLEAILGGKSGSLMFEFRRPEEERHEQPSTTLAKD